MIEVIETLIEDDYRRLADEKNLVWTGNKLPPNNIQPTTWECAHAHTVTACYEIIKDGFLMTDRSAMSTIARQGVVRLSFDPKVISLNRSHNGRTICAILGDRFELSLDGEPYFGRGWLLESITGTSIEHNDPRGFYPHATQENALHGDYTSYLDPVGFGVSTVRMEFSTPDGIVATFEITIHVLGCVHLCSP